MIDNKFVLSKVLGRGGSSKVFLAHDASNQKVAIKAIRKDKGIHLDAAAAMLQKEHDLLQYLSGHPNIIKSLQVNLNGTVRSGNESESVMYNVLEHAKHGALSNFVRYTGGIEESLTKLFALQLCNALKYVHDLNYAHLDIKLENILLDEFFNIKLADFGSSFWTSDTNGRINKKRGTLLYMAPEVANFEVGQEYDAKASDIYSLGITLYVMMIGEFPTHKEVGKNLDSYESDSKQTVDTEMEEEDAPKSGLELLSKDFRNLFQTMTHPDPSKRPTINEVLSSSWLNTEITSLTLGEAYDEMIARKEHMVTMMNMQE